MKKKINTLMMTLVCFLSYGRLSFRSAYNTIYQGQEKSPLFKEIVKSAFGDEFPEDADTFSFLTLTDLNRMAACLGLSPGHSFADLACGRGGPGLWLARKTGASVRGVDISETAVAAATRRIPEFGLAGRAAFSTGDFYHTGLATGSCDAAVSVDALWLASDRDRALTETARILSPKAPFVFTTWDGNIPFMPDSYRKDLEAAGFAVEVYEETKGWKERQLAVYKKILASADALVREMGTPAAKALVREARSTPPVLEKSTRILVAATKA